GHLLLSTLHTNSAAGAVTRLIDMGIDDFLLTSTLHVILGQRLVRTLCTECRTPPAPSAEIAARHALALPPNTSWYQPGSCAACHRTGFRGRTAILEALVLNDEIRAAILAHSDAQTIERIAVKNGMRTMLRHGLARVTQGVTTV